MKTYYYIISQKIIYQIKQYNDIKIIKNIKI